MVCGTYRSKGLEERSRIERERQNCMFCGTSSIAGQGGGGGGGGRGEGGGGVGE